MSNMKKSQKMGLYLITIVMILLIGLLGKLRVTQKFGHYQLEIALLKLFIMKSGIMPGVPQFFMTQLGLIQKNLLLL